MKSDETSSNFGQKLLMILKKIPETILRVFVSIGKTIWQLTKSFIKLHKKIYNPKNFFHIDNALSLLTIYIFLEFILVLNFEILNPVGEAFEDVALNDVIFSRMDKNSEYREVVDGVQEYDKDIVLINIGDFNRAQLGNLSWVIAQFEPKVAAYDALFAVDQDYRAYVPAGANADSIRLANTYHLSGAMGFFENVVYARQGYLPDSLEFAEEQHYDTLDYTTPIIMNGENNRVPALANLYQPASSRSGMAVCRQICPKALIEKDSVYMDHFTSAILKIYAPEKYERLMKRGNVLEYINYTGNIYPIEERFTMNPEDYEKRFPFQRFLAYDWSTFCDNNGIPKDIDSTFREELKRKIQGKIVMFGYMNERISSQDNVDLDNFFTPLNPQYVGKAEKDMYGVVIHANALSMMLNEKYIDVMPDWLGHIIGLIVTYIVFASFRPIYMDYKNWYDGLTKFLGIILSIVLLAIIGMVFVLWDYEINFPAFYFGCILLAGDWLEVYYGFLKNFVQRVRKNM